MDSNTAFRRLLEPGYIGKVRTRNRIIKTAAGMSFVGEYGFSGDRRKAFYGAIARGGAGLVIVEPCPVSYPLGAYLPDLIRIDDDRFLPGLTALTGEIHKYGCPAFLQLVHAGAWHQIPSSSDAWLEPWPVGLQRVSSSLLTREEFPGPYFDVPRAATRADIVELIGQFVAASERARRAGFEGVEINADTAHLINSFFSRIYNKRHDDYGVDSLENRARFAVEIVSGIRKRLGPDFAVTILVNGAEYGHEKGTPVEEARAFARMLEAAGADAIQVRAHGYGEYSDMIFPEHLFYPAAPDVRPTELDWSRHGAGLTVPLAAAIKEAVSIPVIGVGRLDPALGERLLEDGKVDFVGMSRRLMADPELPHKLAAGRLDDITPCTACLGCITEILNDRPVRCRINAALGGEEEYYHVTPAPKQKKVVVVGGGPAGMEAARVAATRGHRVQLFAKERRLGGLVPLAAVVKGTEIEDLPALVRYFKTQLARLGVSVRLGTACTPRLIEEIKPDVIILAAGGVPSVPGIPGIDRRNVVSSLKLHRQLKSYLRFVSPGTLRWLTKFWIPLGERVVIIGGALQGCEVAEFLVKRGRQVTMVDTAPTLGEGLVESSRGAFFSWLEKKGATVIAGVKYEEITDRGLVITTGDGQRRLLEADTIVTALPFQPNTRLIEEMAGKAPEIYAIGDCAEPRIIMDAVGDAYRVARAI